MKRTIYRALNPPFSGGKGYVVKDTKTAINVVKILNKTSKKKDWSWA